MDSSSLLGMLKAELASIDRFCILLNTEQEALKKGKTEQLVTLSEQKGALVAELNQLTNQRNQAMQDSGYTPDTAGITAWVGAEKKRRITETPSRPSPQKTPPGAPASAKNAMDPILAVQKHWLLLQKKAEEARELNRLNGQLINVFLQHNANAINALRGGSGQGQLYGRNGQAHSLTGSRIIDAA